MFAFKAYIYNMAIFTFKVNLSDIIYVLIDVYPWPNRINFWFIVVARKAK
jgi:hypothetical protein